MRDDVMPERLLDQARGGTPNARGELLEHYRNYLRLVARSLISGALRVKLEPSDLVQETFLKAHREFAQFAGRTEPELVAWLRQILVRSLANQVKHHRRQARNHRRQESLERLLDQSSITIQQALASYVSSPSEQASRREQAVLLADALNRLPDDYREAFIRRTLEHVPFEKIAAEMGRSVGAVRMLWARAVKRLTQMLGGRAHEVDETSSLEPEPRTTHRPTRAGTGARVVSLGDGGGPTRRPGAPGGRAPGDRRRAALLPGRLPAGRAGRGDAERRRSCGLRMESRRHRLGDFRILRQIGRGGMGIVYEAEQVSLHRRVALKVLPFAAALDPHQLQRFQTEAQAAAQLHHTNIVPVFAVGCERGVHYYAMQYIEGQTLAAVIRDLRRLEGLEKQRARERRRPRGSLGRRGRSPAGWHHSNARAAGSWRRARLSPRLRSVGSRRQSGPAPSSTPVNSQPRLLPHRGQLGMQAAEALEHAHRMGIVHRDIKPANLLVDVRGNLWITDFGLARMQADAGLTLTGDVLGTLRYMSPEQALARRASSITAPTSTRWA